MKPELAYKAWDWPEFQAFAKRLGINMSVATTHLTIVFPIDSGDVVKVIQEYVPEEKPDASEAI
jgi:hypothetical protein